MLGPRRAIVGRLGQDVLRQQRGQCRGPQSHARGFQELPPSLQPIVIVDCFEHDISGRVDVMRLEHNPVELTHVRTPSVHRRVLVISRL